MERTLLTVLEFGVTVCAGVTIAAHYLRPPRRVLIYVFKPLTTILILAAALAPGTFITEPYARAVAAGLLFSLAGDIWLMLPRDRFAYGLGAFLLVHLCYIIAFQSGASANGFAVVLLLLMAVGGAVLAYLWQGMAKKLRGAVALYVAVIVLMTALAVGRAITGSAPGTLSAAVGAVLFMISDGALAINRFRRPFRLAHAAILGTYVAAQWMIARSG